MRIRFLFASLPAITAAIPTILLAADLDSRIGGWTERRGTASYEGLRRSFEDLGGGVVRVNIALDPQGKPRSFAELRCDGRPKPVQGGDPGPAMTLACRTLDVRTTEFTFARAADAGWTRSTGREQVSPDGSVMTVSAVQTDAKGATVARIERIFDRQR
jgi:hypothetical protein